MSQDLGPEIQRLRTEAGFTLRGFARAVGISAAHQSDIERGRRMPGEEVLRAMARELAAVGGTYEHLKALDARINQELQDWAESTPEVAAMLRSVRDSGRSPREVLDELRQLLDADANNEPPKPPDSPSTLSPERRHPNK